MSAAALSAHLGDAAFSATTQLLPPGARLLPVFAGRLTVSGRSCWDGSLVPGHSGLRNWSALGPSLLALRAKTFETGPLVRRHKDEALAAVPGWPPRTSPRGAVSLGGVPGLGTRMGSALAGITQIGAGTFVSSFSDAARLAFDQRYRRYLITLILSGTAESSSLPIVSLYVTKSLGVSNGGIGFLWMTMLAGSIISLCVGYLSDRLRSDFPYVRYAALWLALGWFALIYARTFAEVLLVFALSLSTAPVLDSQIFTALEGVMTASDETRRSFVTSTLRAGFSVGYVIGPALGAVMVNSAGFRGAFSVTAALFLMAAAVARNIRSRAPGGERAAKAARNGRRNGYSLIVLILFCVCVCCVLCGDFVKYSYLSLYVVDVLKGSLGLYSGVIAVGAALEVLAFPVFGALADRFGARPVIAVGLLLAIGDYGILALSPHVWSVYVSQILHVSVVAIVYGVCAAYAQSLVRDRVGIATTSFFVSISLAQIGAGGIGASFAATLGLQHLFWIPSIAAAIGLAVFALLCLRSFTPAADGQVAAAGESRDVANGPVLR